MKVIPQSVTLCHHTPNPEREIELAGRTCWKSCKEDTENFIKMILDKHHDSVLEHAVASFRVITDRAIANELVRHRIASYSQESTRYVDQQDFKVIMPSGMSGKGFEVWKHAMTQAEANYTLMREEGVSPQQARSVLPLCLATEIVVTMNFRSWRNFLKLRLAKSAHPEMRELAAMIQVELRKIAPTVFENV